MVVKCPFAPTWTQTWECWCPRTRWWSRRWRCASRSTGGLGPRSVWDQCPPTSRMFWDLRLIQPMDGLQWAQLLQDHSRDKGDPTSVKCQMPNLLCQMFNNSVLSFALGQESRRQQIQKTPASTWWPWLLWRNPLMVITRKLLTNSYFNKKFQTTLISPYRSVAFIFPCLHIDISKYSNSYSIRSSA